MLGGQKLFPHPMGLCASGDPSLAYRTARAIGLQARAIGANMIHSPVLDVNTNPKNPEIGTRAYSDKTNDVTAYALQSLKGFQEVDLMATGKHFPGRGESMADAHFGLPVADLAKDELMQKHIEPYKQLIAAGLPTIMSAHTIYPALGDSERPATMSRRIITEFLRGELGFKGVVTTDNMIMGGILKKYWMPEAIVQALIAGCDLILCRDESPARIIILQEVKKAIQEKRLKESELDEKVKRILELRWKMGLAEKGGLVDPEKADALLSDKFITKTAVEAGEKSVLLLKDKKELSAH